MKRVCCVCVCAVLLKVSEWFCFSFLFQKNDQLHCWPQTSMQRGNDISKWVRLNVCLCVCVRGSRQFIIGELSSRVNKINEIACSVPILDDDGGGGHSGGQTVGTPPTSFDGQKSQNLTRLEPIRKEYSTTTITAAVSTQNKKKGIKHKHTNASRHQEKK